MTASLVVKAEIREKTGKGVARTLRRNGRIPAVIYGKGQAEVLVSVPKKEMQLLHSKFDAMTTVIDLEVQDKKYSVLPKQISLDPTTDFVEHIDFIFISNENKIKVKVPVLVTGAEKSPGIKRSGTINLSNRFVNCLVDKASITASAKIDISNMNIGDIVRYKDLELPSGMIIQEKSLDKVLLKIAGKKAMKSEEEKNAESSEGGEGSNKEEAAKSGAKEGSK